MKRLVLFTPGHAEPGGAAKRSRLIAGQLALNGWDVRVITRAGTLRAPRIHRDGNLTVVEVPGFNRRRLGAALFLITSMALGIWWGLRSRAFVAIQLMSTSTAAGLCSLLARRPYLALSTTSGVLSESVYIRGTLLSAPRRWLLRSATYLIAQTEEVAIELKELTSSHRVVVLPNPVRLVSPPPLNGDPVALFAGRFSAEKDLLLLLSAWETVIEDVSGARLILAGAGGEYRSVESELRAAVSASSPLMRTVSLPGWLDDLGPMLASVDVFVLPSREEGMSNALLEACAHRRLVVASDIAPNRAVLGADYPLLFRGGDRVALTSSLIRAFAMHDQERAGIQSRLETRVRPYSCDAVVTRLEELIASADRTRH